ncbi:MAG: DUF3592 domain-containing protein, partial [Candidatus Poseidoniales archaeon]|nr:DUF3592 domain-containing protein [Candidatus Poseidoniales archaeon]
QDFLDFALMLLNGEEPDREWHHSESDDADHSESDYTPGEGTWAGLAIFWVITLVVCTVSVFVTTWIVGDITADLGTDEWTPVDGVIIDSGVNTEVSQDSEGGSSTTYCLWVEYEYTIENRTYGGSKLSYSKEGSCNSWSENADDDYPSGKNVTVYVNPDNHEEAVLLPGLSGVDFFIFCFLIFPLCGIGLFGFCCMATYNSIMHPEKYIVGNFVPGDTSTSLPSLESDEDHTRSSGVDLDGDGIADDLYGVKSNKILDTFAFGTSFALIGGIAILLVINGIAAMMALDTASMSEISPQDVEGSEDWPTTTGWFTEDFDVWWDDETGEEYFSGSIVIYCSEDPDVESTIWKCPFEGVNNSANERIEIPLRCTETEAVGPWDDPCSESNRMIVIDTYYMDESFNWVHYDTCEWEGHSPEDEDNTWSCYWDSDGDGIADDYDIWWYYCEYDDNESTWHCTNTLGSEISSPDNRNGTLRPGPREIPALVNYDPTSPTRIVLIEIYNMGSEWGGVLIMPLFILGIIDVVLITRIGCTIYKYKQTGALD